MIRVPALRRAGALAIALLTTALTSSAQAATSVPLGSADAFAVLAGSTITNTGGSVINGDLGLHPGTAVTGFPPGTVNGSEHITDAVALQAKADLTTAYNDAAGRPRSAASPPDIGGQTLTAGVYKTGSVPALELTGNVTLDAQGDPRAVFIFQAESTLITATDSSVTLTNGAQACNVYWQVGSSATLGTRTAFKGTVMAMTSISVNDSVRIDGRLLARSGAVTLINDTITRSGCATDSEGDSSGGGETSDATTAGDGTGGRGTGGGSTTTAAGAGATETGATSGTSNTAAQPPGETGSGGGRTTTADRGSGKSGASGGPGGDADTGATGGGDATSGGADTGDATGRGKKSADDAAGGGGRANDGSTGFLADGNLPFTGLDIRFLLVGLGLVLLGIGLRVRARHQAG